jgi:hypothetical protein
VRPKISKPAEETNQMVYLTMKKAGPTISIHTVNSGDGSDRINDIARFKFVPYSSELVVHNFFSQLLLV